MVGRPCLVCGVVFEGSGSRCVEHVLPDRRPSRLERGRRSRSKWVERVRPAVLRRCGGCCEGCGARVGSGGLHVHHVVGVAEGGGDELSNLRALCEGCHVGVHHPR